MHLSSKRVCFLSLAALVLILGPRLALRGQTTTVTGSPTSNTAEVTVRLIVPGLGKSPELPRVPLVIWLVPARPLATSPAVYTLLQRNKQFSPHLLVVSVGSTVHFPNQDPYFHNVFSLFNGRRFDLGLYETGTTRDVTFSREGVSYIFCNIHPEMSAVILALATPFYGMAEAIKEQTLIRLHDVPQGRYTVHVWVEGENERTLDTLTRAVEVSLGHADLGPILVPTPVKTSVSHDNKFGLPYDTAHPAAY